MINETWPPAAHRASVPSHRAVVIAAVLLASGFAAPVPDASPLAPLQGAPSSRDDDSRAKIEDRLAALATAFRSEDARGIADLLPEEGKVFLSITITGIESGYYGRDQVYFIFQKIFSQHDTTRFSIRLQGSKDPSPGLAYGVANWAFRRKDGSNSDTVMHFVFSKKNGGWALVQIREAR